MIKAIASTVLLAISGFANPVSASDLAREIAFDIPEQPLAQALAEFSRQSDVIIVVSTEVTQGKTSKAVNFTATPARALDRMLEGSRLQYTQEKDGSIVVKAALRTSTLPASEALRLAHATDEASAAADASAAPAGGLAAEDASVMPEVLVRGSKSLNVDIGRDPDGPQPYYIMSGEEIERSGASTVEDFLKQRFTMNTTAATNQQAGSSNQGATSTINLRGLGPDHTLVLLNGHRVAGVSFEGGARGANQFDVNSLPVAMIDRIESLPSSAAAIYGGSAIGGVVNVVLKRNFVGGSLKLGYENTEATNAPIRTADAIYGLELEEGRTHLMVGVHYSDLDAILNRDRDGLRKGVERVYRNYPQALLSPTAPFHVGTTPNIGSADGSNLTLKGGLGALGSPITYVPAGFSVGSDPAAFLANAGSLNLDLSPTADRRTGLLAPIGASPRVKSVLTSIRRAMSDRVDAFAELSYLQNRSLSVFDPNWRNYTVPASSPANPFEQNVIVSFPTTLSPGSFEVDNVNRRALAGIVVHLPRDWHVEADYSWSENEFKYGGENWQIAAPFIGAGFASGELNPFVDTLAHPEQVDLSPYLGSSVQNPTATLKDISLRAVGRVWQMAGGPATLALGLAHRKEGYGDYGDFPVFPNFPALTRAWTTYFLGQSQSTLSGYAELNMPLIGNDNALSFAKKLDLQVAGRTERYSVSAGTNYTFPDDTTPLRKYDIDYQSSNPTFALLWKPFSSLTLRSSYGTAFLPPSYTNLVPGIPTTESGLGPIHTVVDPRRGNSTVMVDGVDGGNPDLKPEKSRSLNIGFIFQPESLPGLRLGLEWYRIKQRDLAFSGFGSSQLQQIVNLEAQFPDRVIRGPVSPGDPYGVGPITFVNGTTINVNRAESSGFDLSFGYLMQTSRYGTFDLAAAATEVKHFKVQNTPTGPLDDIVDQVAAGGPLGTRANASLTWNLKPWTVSWSTIHYGSYLQNSVGGATAYVLAQGSDHIPSQTYHNVLASYDLERPGAAIASRTRFNLGIKNVFDKAPAFDAFYSGNSSYYYYSPFGDPRMRSYWLSVETNF